MATKHQGGENDPPSSPASTPIRKAKKRLMHLEVAKNRHVADVLAMFGKKTGITPAFHA